MNDKIVIEVLKGKWGKGAERKRRLIEAGYDYDKIQSKVNYASFKLYFPLYNILAIKKSKELEKESE